MPSRKCADDVPYRKGRNGTHSIWLTIEMLN